MANFKFIDGPLAGKSIELPEILGTELFVPWLKELPDGCDGYFDEILVYRVFYRGRWLDRENGSSEFTREIALRFDRVENVPFYW